MALYTKPYLSLSDQLSLLKMRGLLVADDAAAIECLHRNGYYRLSAYWYPFRQIVRDPITNISKRSDTFLSGSHFDDAISLYRFDKHFKLMLLDAIERVEIAVRVEISLILGKRDPFAHTNPRSFHARFTSVSSSGQCSYQDWIDKFDNLYARSRAEFILHHKNQYGVNSPLPIWIAIELWDFGMLSYAFSGMRNSDQVAVAARFGIPDWQVLESWLRRLNFVRNVIAHHGRLWNANLNRPRFPVLGDMPDFDSLLLLSTAHPRIYSICCILCYLTRIVNSASPWIHDMKKLVVEFPKMPHANTQDMGFPSNWQDHSLWK